MDGVDVRVFEQLVVVGVARLDAELVAALVEFRLVAPADGVHLGVRMVLVDGNELGPEAEADDGDADFLVGWHAWVLPDDERSFAASPAESNIMSAASQPP